MERAIFNKSYPSLIVPIMFSFESVIVTAIAAPLRVSFSTCKIMGKCLIIFMKSIARAVAVSMGRMWRSVRYATDFLNVPRNAQGIVAAAKPFRSEA